MDPIRATLLQGILFSGGVGADELNKPRLYALVEEKLLWIPKTSFAGEVVRRPIYRLTDLGRVVASSLAHSETRSPTKSSNDGLSRNHRRVSKTLSPDDIFSTFPSAGVSSAPRPCAGSGRRSSER